RMRGELLQRDLDGALELRIMALPHETGIVPHGHIGTHSMVLHGESAVETLYRKERRRDSTPIHQFWSFGGGDQSAPGTLTNDGADVVHLEKPRQSVASRARELIDHHDLGAVDRLRRAHLHASPSRDEKRLGLAHHVVHHVV